MIWKSLKFSYQNFYSVNILVRFSPSYHCRKYKIYLGFPPKYLYKCPKKHAINLIQLSCFSPQPVFSSDHQSLFIASYLLLEATSTNHLALYWCISFLLLLTKVAKTQQLKTTLFIISQFLWIRSLVRAYLDPLAYLTRLQSPQIPRGRDPFPSLLKWLLTGVIGSRAVEGMPLSVPFHMDISVEHLTT